LSAHRRRHTRLARFPHDHVDDLDLWWRAVGLRGEWLGHAMSTAPADRATTERCVSALYALLDRSPPAFVWVGSPAAATEVVRPEPTTPVPKGPWPLENRVATLVSALRERLDRRVGRAWRDPYARPTGPPPDPLAALRSGYSLRSILDAGIRDPLRRAVRGSVAEPVRAALSGQTGLCWGGQHDADWVAHYQVHHQVLGVRFAPADLAQLDLWAALARSCGWWWPREDVCVVAERPVAVRTEPVPGADHDETRLHDANGPAVLFPDGWAVHSWHGTRVPAWVIEAPTVDLITREANIEVRRCAIERIGWTAFVDMAGLALVAQAADPGNPGGDLRLYDLPREPSGPPARLLLAVNGSVERDGTRRRYGLRVPAWLDDPIDAAGWSYGLSGAQYAQLRRRT
jgi:hypothetical protein